MILLRISNRTIQLIAARRRASFLEEVAACGKFVGDRWEFDREGECWKKLQARSAKDKKAQNRGSGCGQDWLKSEAPRKLWKELHRRAMSSKPLVPADEEVWLLKFRARIKCNDCLRHWLELLKLMPPELSSRESYFAWTVAAHNAVNQAIGKKVVTVEAARATYE